MLATLSMMIEQRRRTELECHSDISRPTSVDGVVSRSTLCGFGTRQINVGRSRLPSTLQRSVATYVNSTLVDPVLSAPTLVTPAKLDRVVIENEN